MSKKLIQIKRPFLCHYCDNTPMSDSWRSTLIEQLQSDELTYAGIINTINVFRRLLNAVLFDQSIEDDRRLYLATIERFGPNLTVDEFECTNPALFIDQILIVVRQTITHLRHPQLYHQKIKKTTSCHKRKHSRK